VAKRQPATGIKKTKGNKPDGTTDDSRALAATDTSIYVLRLCISGMNIRSRHAVENIKHLCEVHLPGHYELEVIDLYQQPELAVKHQVIATPTLLKTLPTPARRLIGDLSNTKEALRRLGIAVKKDSP
jgi:circadian clock protein KaiB